MSNKEVDMKNAPSASAVGQLGLKSIRIANTKIDDLPLVAGAHAKRALPAAIEMDKRMKVAGIMAKYPPETIGYLEGWIKECTGNVDRCKILKNEQSAIINEYTGQISMCEYRDKELENLDPDVPGDAAQIKALKLKFPPYNVGKMNQQIGFCREAIERADDVIAKEFESIAMLTGRINECKHRDMELKAVGADPIG